MAHPNGKSNRLVSQQTRQRQSRSQLTRRQMEFVRQYACLGNAAEAARRAGYRSRSAKEIGCENLTKLHVKAAVDREMARVALEITPERVQRRLDEISHASQDAGQFGPAVRAEELLGKSIGMWIDQSLRLSGAINDSHIQAVLEVARKRREQPIDLEDDV
jgi:hypothetical protein